MQQNNYFRALNQQDFRKEFLKNLGYPHRPQFIALADFAKDILDMSPPGSLILDVGAGECKWKKLFMDCNYIGIDNCVGDENWNYKLIDIVGSAENLPIADNSVDTVICIALLGHVLYPYVVLNEAFRVLKPGGKLFGISEFAKAKHQVPFDFTRLTDHAIVKFCTEIGFEMIDVNGSNSFFTSILNLIESYAWKTSARGLGAIVPLFLKGVIKLRFFDILYSLGDSSKEDNHLFPTYFFISAQKPASMTQLPKTIFLSIPYAMSSTYR